MSVTQHAFTAAVFATIFAAASVTAFASAAATAAAAQHVFNPAQTRATSLRHAMVVANKRVDDYSPVVRFTAPYGAEPPETMVKALRELESDNLVFRIYEYPYDAENPLTPAFSYETVTETEPLKAHCSVKTFSKAE